MNMVEYDMFTQLFRNVRIIHVFIRVCDNVKKIGIELRTTKHRHLKLKYL